MTRRGWVIVAVIVLVLLLVSKKPASAATVPSITGAGGSSANPLSAIGNAIKNAVSHFRAGSGPGGSAGAGGGGGSSAYIDPGYAADPSNYAPGGIAYQDPGTVLTPGTDAGTLPAPTYDSAGLSGFDPNTGLPVGYGTTATPAGTDYVDPFNDPSSVDPSTYGG